MPEQFDRNYHNEPTPIIKKEVVKEKQKLKCFEVVFSDCLNNKNDMIRLFLVYFYRVSAITMKNKTYQEVMNEWEGMDLIAKKLQNLTSKKYKTSGDIIQLNNIWEKNCIWIGTFIQVMQEKHNILQNADSTKKIDINKFALNKKPDKKENSETKSMDLQEQKKFEI